MAKIIKFLSWAYLLAIYGFIFLPVAVLVLFSFQDSILPIPPFTGPTLKWYSAIFQDEKLMGALLNSIGVAVLSSLVACTLGFMSAWGLSRHVLPAAKLQRALLIIPMTVSYLIIALGLLILFKWLDFPKSLWTVGIGHVVINLPLCFAIIYAAMGAHQVNIERAARDLGGNTFQVLRLITIPMLSPPLIAAFFLSVTFSWDEFIISFLLSRFNVTLPVEIWSLLQSGLSPKTNAIGSFVFLVSIALLILLEIFVFRKRKT